MKLLFITISFDRYHGSENIQGLFLTTPNKLSLPVKSDTLK